MSDDDPKEKDGIYRVQTVPPPDGASDVYNAPTKVGPMATSVIQELIEQAQRTGGVVEANQASTAIEAKKIAPAMPPPPMPTAQRSTPTPLPVLDRATPVESIDAEDLEEVKADPPAEKPMEKLDSAHLAELVSQEAAALSDAERASVPRSSSTPVRAATPETPPRTSDAPITNAELGRNPHMRLLVIGAVLLALVIMVFFVAAKLMP